MDLSLLADGPITNAAAAKVTGQRATTLAIVAVRATVTLPEAAHLITIASNGVATLLEFVAESWVAAAVSALTLTGVLAHLPPPEVRGAVAAPGAEALPPLVAPALLALAGIVPLAILAVLEALARMRGSGLVGVGQQGGQHAYGGQRRDVAEQAAPRGVLPDAASQVIKSLLVHRRSSIGARERLTRPA